MLDDNSPEFINEDSYKDLFDNSNDLIQVLDLEGKLILVNQAWLTQTGYAWKEVEGRPIYDFVRVEDQEKFIEYRKALIEKETSPEVIVLGLKRKNGSDLFIEGSGSLRKKEGKPWYTRGIFRDITGKLQQQEELKEREKNFSDLLINAPDAVIVIDEGGLIRFWNPRAEKIFGWSSEEVTDLPLSEVIIPVQYREAHQQGMKRYLATGEARVLNNTIEITALNKLGNEFHVSLTISASRQNGKKVFVAFLRDISEKKRVEEELEKRRTQLELSNEQLQQFAHAASHDMKEPVRKILLFAGRLDKEYGNLLPEKAKDYFSKIDNASHRLWNIVEGFLNYSSVHTYEERYELIDLATILKSIENDLEILISEKKAQLNFTGFPEFHGIPFLIYQLFYNLIYNSLKFSREDVDPVINISGFVTNPELVTSETQSGPVTIKVTDNGIGFEAAHSQKIFKTFTRLNLQNKFEGTGLGLALCKSIVERHKGEITAEGSPGEGAVFTIVLPGEG